MSADYFYYIHGQVIVKVLPTDTPPERRGSAASRDGQLASPDYDIVIDGDYGVFFFITGARLHQIFNVISEFACAQGSILPDVKEGAVLYSPRAVTLVSGDIDAAARFAA